MAEEVDEDFFVVLAGDRGEPLHTARSLGKLQGRAGRLQAAVGRMVELHEHLAGLHLRIGDHLRDVVDRGGGDTAGGQRLDDFGLGARARPALDDGGDLVAPVAPGRGRRESGVRREIAPADDLAEAAPDRVAGSGGDRDVAVGRRIDARAGPAERNVARACEDLAADRVALAEVVEGDEQAVQERQVDALAVARSLTVVQRRHDAEGAEHPGVIVRDRLTRAGGRMIGEAGDAHVAADRLGQHVVAALGSVRSVLAEGRDRGVDDVGLHHFEVFVAEPEALESADAEVLGHHVRAANELLEKLDATRGFQLEGDTELVAVPVLRRGHALLDAVAPALDAQRDALLPALPRLDLDHPRSHVGQEHRAEGHGDDLSQVQHRDVAQRLIHVPSMAAKPAPPRRYCAGPAGRVNRRRIAIGPGTAGCRLPRGWVIALNPARRTISHGADMDLRPKRYVDTVVLSPVGRIDHATSEDFKIALAPYMTRCAEGQDRVVLDFAGVEYISSVGLRVLMLASKQAKAQRGALGIAALQPAVREIFDISRFTMVLDVFPSVREGLARLSPKALAAFDAA